LRLLRIGGFIESERGANGGYTLSKDPSKIYISDVLNFIGENYLMIRFAI
jgi:DNA-binding IscR family transcriptional regulator